MSKHGIERFSSDAPDLVIKDHSLVKQADFVDEGDVVYSTSHRDGAWKARRAVVTCAAGAHARIRFEDSDSDDECWRNVNELFVLLH